MSTKSELIKQMITLIQGGWTHNVLARDAEGMPCLPSHPDAKFFCIRGALMRIHDKYDDVYFDTLLSIEKTLNEMKVSGQSGLCLVVAFNDAHGRTKEEVIDMLSSVRC